MQTPASAEVQTALVESSRVASRRVAGMLAGHAGPLCHCVLSDLAPLGYGWQATLSALSP